MRVYGNTSALIIGASVFAVGTCALGQVTTDETRAIVSEMLADAESRSSLLSGASSGHDGRGFYIQGDGVDLTIGGILQVRHVTGVRDEDDPDDFETGFEMRRTKLNFTGTVADDWNFRIEANFDDDGGAFTLEDAFITYGLGNGWAVGVGQVKAPLSRETLVEGEHQLAIERSLIDEFFSGGYTQAAFIVNQSEDTTFAFGFSDGARAVNSDFGSDAQADWAVSTRGQYKFMGEWDQFQDFTSFRGSDTAVMVGGAFHAQGGPTIGKGSQTGDPADTDLTILRYWADVSAEGDGWNAFAALSGQYFQARSMAGNAYLNDYGVVVQGGVFAGEKIELFARYEGLWLDDDRGIDDDNFHFLTVGMNHYYAGHAAKASADAVIALTDTDELVAIGLLPNSNTNQLGSVESGEVTFRLQFQLLF